MVVGLFLGFFFLVYAMRLIEVTDAATAQQWLDLPGRLHAARPAYIGPLYNELEAVFDPQKNKRLSHGEAARWIVLSSAGKAVGRIAAFLDREAPDVTNPALPTGGLGFFESTNTTEVATMLFDAAQRWLKVRGMQAMDGPINFGDRDRFWGVLIDGFDFEPNYGMFWHPPYYQALFEFYGFQLYFKQYTCHMRADNKFHASFAKLVEQFAASGEYRFAYASKAEPEKLAQDFQHVYNLAWAKHTGVALMTLGEARAIVKQMLPVVDERLLWFAYHGEEPVAFFLSLPELNQIFKHIGQRLNLLGKLRFVVARWRFMQRRDKKILGIIYGVVPEHQGKGVDIAMVATTQPVVLAAGYEDIEMNWIGDFNPRMLVTIRTIGARIRKTHATYRFLFDRERTFERHPIIK